jgi:Tol biopolymer transport system component
MLAACADEPPTALDGPLQTAEPRPGQRPNERDPEVAFAAVGARGRIAFTSNRSGVDEVYIMNADGTGLTNLTYWPAYASAETQPVLSADGRYVAVRSDITFYGNFGLYVLPTDGSFGWQIAGGPGDQFSPVWSPDGKRVAFASDHTGDTEIFVVNSAGTGLTQLTNSPGVDIPGSWSREGIYFESSRDGNREIYRMKADGSGITRLTTSIGDDEHPRVSPKGNQILFDSVRDGNLELYVMNADGSNPVRLTNFAGEDYMGAWAPTGKQIVFASNRMQGEHLWRMNADGSGLAQLTSGAGFDTWPSWSR